MYHGVATGRGIQNILQIDRNKLLQPTTYQSIELHSITSIDISSGNKIVQQNTTPLHSQNESTSQKATFQIKEIYITSLKQLNKNTSSINNKTNSRFHSL